MKYLYKILRQFFCIHNWDELASGPHQVIDNRDSNILNIRGYILVGYLKFYVCTKCKKVIMKYEDVIQNP